jgi:hypothetical protein
MQPGCASEEQAAIGLFCVRVELFEGGQER